MLGFLKSVLSAKSRLQGPIGQPEVGLCESISETPGSRAIRKQSPGGLRQLLVSRTTGHLTYQDLSEITILALFAAGFVRAFHALCVAPSSSVGRSAPRRPRVARGSRARGAGDFSIVFRLRSAWSPPSRVRLLGSRFREHDPSHRLFAAYGALRPFLRSSSPRGS